MKSKLALFFSLLILLWLFVPVSTDEDYIRAVSEVVPVDNNEKDTWPLNEEDSSLSTEAVKPLKNYFLTLLSDGSRREIKIDPPATRIEVISESGDTAVRCGDGFQNYSCIPGKRLELVYDRDAPIEKFWGENQSENQVRLRIEIYQQIETETTEVPVPNSSVETNTDDTELPDSSVEPS